ncbi:MAG: FAD:protein FMN transferase [Cycloclasticus sp.]|nr:FAD:protein FMN transferase [Cycloclasticus sp.]
MSAIKRPVKNLVFLTGFFIGVILLAACDATNGPALVISGQTMGTTYHISLSNNPIGHDATEIKEGIEQRLLEVNQSFSTYIDSSEVSTLNQYTGNEGQKKSAAFIQVLAEAQGISFLTEGAYDITVGPLVNLWGFGPEFSEDDIPLADNISQALKKVGYTNIIFDRETRQVKKLIPELYIDFSSIAKGYGVDIIAEHLESLGFNDYMVEIGGEMRLRGNNPEGTKWRIAVEKPDPAKRSIQRIIKLSNTAIATSGDYRNFFIKDGIRFSHTIDPTTGSPVRHNLASVTVLTPSSMTADAWATAFMVLGPEKGYDLAMKNNLSVLFIVKENDDYIELMTPQFQQFFKDKAA